MRFLFAVVVGLLAATAASGAEPIEFEYFGGLRFDESVPSPEAYLGRPLGERFTRHHEIDGYVRALAEASDRVTLTEYGSSVQRRPLVILTISSPDNLGRIDEVLENNRKLAEPGAGHGDLDAVVRDNPTIAWLSYGVHGNEASAPETALQVAYTLAAATNPEVLEILDNVVVVIDPCLNPDGRQRYVSWYENEMGTEPDPDVAASEHFEPWPGGRTNHYLFDLNRDWVWLTQAESRQRLEIYRRYLPHLHIDYHEQGYQSPYFFGPGDTPYNANIPKATKEWVELYGRANAEAFDERGIVYATRERFDYLYPGYGKVLPVYHGAVGMLCEKGGHGRAGLAIDFNEHEVLTLRERTRDHFVTSMSYLETSAANREGQNKRFRAFFANSAEPEEPVHFVISSENDPALLAKTFDLLAAHGVEVRQSEASITGELRRLIDGTDADEAPAGSWIVRTDQAMGRLARALFEPDPVLEDRDTYDITSWSLPIAFGLDGWWTGDDVTGEVVASYAEPRGRVVGEGEAALVVPADSHRFVRAVGAAIRHDLFARVAGGDIELGGRTFPMGSLIVHTTRNGHADLDAFIDDATASGVDVHRVASTWADRGPSLGNNKNRRLALPKIALVRGEGFGANSFGNHWWMLDVEAGLPHTVVDVDDLSSVDLDGFDVVVLPSGRATSAKSVLAGFVRGGGTLVCSGRSAHWATEHIVEEEDEDREDDRGELSELTNEERRQRGVEDRVPGATVRLSVDTTHPLSAGVRDIVGVIKRDADVLAVKDEGRVIARYAEEVRSGGSISDRNAEHIAGSPAMTLHTVGRGRVIAIADDPTLRGFQHAPMRLLLNAVVYGR